MATDENFLSSPWLDKKSLELWLGKYYGDMTITDVEIEDSPTKGDNYLSSIKRMVVRSKEGGTYPLIVKVRMEEGMSAEILKDSQIFRKEKDMYNVTLPKIHEILQKVTPDNFEPLWPICFYSCKTFLVMEDLVPAGFKMENRRVGLDLEHCSLVVRTIARFHAASLILYQREPDCMDMYLQSFYHEPSTEGNWEKLILGLAKTLVEELDTWPEEWKKYADILRNQIPNFYKRLQKIIDRGDSAFNVLTHGDAWTNNIVFSEDVQRIRLLDFQLVYFGSPVLDLHYLLTTSATLQVRINDTDKLLQEYHNTLRETLTALDYTQKVITLEELHKEFDSKAYYGLFALISPYAVMQCSTDCGFSLDEGLDKGKNPGPIIYGEQYKKSVKWLLPLFEKNGAFADK